MLLKKGRAIAAGLVTIALLSGASCDDLPVAPYVPTETAEVEQSPQDKVNSLPYEFMNAGPALEAFLIVTKARGWPEGDPEKWIPFVNDVMAKESGYCWNLRRGAKPNGDGCNGKQGVHSDSGFGQVLMGYPNRKAWRHGGTSWKNNEHAAWLCGQEGLCRPEDVVASPWNSMVALVALIERSGGGAWCYAAARGYHNCKLVP